MAKPEAPTVGAPSSPRHTAPAALSHAHLTTSLRAGKGNRRTQASWVPGQWHTPALQCPPRPLAGPSTKVSPSFGSPATRPSVTNSCLQLPETLCSRSALTSTVASDTGRVILLRVIQSKSLGAVRLSETTWHREQCVGLGRAGLPLFPWGYGTSLRHLSRAGEVVITSGWMSDRQVTDRAWRGARLIPYCVLCASPRTRFRRPFRERGGGRRELG